MKTKIRKFIRIITREKSAYATVLRIYSVVAAVFILVAMLGGSSFALLRAIEVLLFMFLLFVLRAEERANRRLMYLRAMRRGYDMAIREIKEHVNNIQRGAIPGMMVVAPNRTLGWNENKESEASPSIDFLPISMRYEIDGRGDKWHLFLNIDTGDVVHCHKVDQYQTIEGAKIGAQEHYSKMIKDFFEANRTQI